MRISSPLQKRGRSAIRLGPTVRPGMTLVEMVMTSALALILALSVSMLLNSGSEAWVQTYNTSFSQNAQNASAIVTTFGSIGRKSNRASYILYHINNGVFTPIQASSSQSTALVVGDAVEFRYWDVELDATDSHHLMDPSKIATAYALFYLQNGQLKVDYGAYPPGAVPAGGGARNTTNVTTTVLASNASVDSTAGPFSHTAVSGMGDGCVRLNVILTDSTTGDHTKVVTAALMRNLWPR